VQQLIIKQVLGYSQGIVLLIMIHDGMRDSREMPACSSAGLQQPPLQAQYMHTVPSV
jgi:hypothetical protein